MSIEITLMIMTMAAPSMSVCSLDWKEEPFSLVQGAAE